MFNFLSGRTTTTQGLPVTTGINRLDTLPVILAGPILRHVSTDSITVWLATRQDIPSTTELRVYDELVVNNQPPANSNPTPVANTQTSLAKIQLGTKLYLYLLTCKVPSSTQLTKEKIYGYNIHFSGTDTLATYLSASGTNGMSKITYPGFNRPTFALTPNKLEQTNIVHASCRKPHAAGRDAMSLLGTSAIGPNVANASLRPHLLLLTGDQIYADDVADMLLFMLDDASKALMGWVEKLPDVMAEPNIPFNPNTQTPAIVKPQTSVEFRQVESDTAPLPPSLAVPSNTGKVFASLAPGQRQNTVYRPGAKMAARTTSGLTSDKAKSHLLRLGEYYAMYLFAWSDELWGNFANSGEAWQLVTGETVPTTTATETEKERFFRYKAFSEEYDNVQIFKQDLADVRRALANVPTYMICDDHEVTDDWFLNLAWSQKILGDKQFLLETNAPIPSTRRASRPTIQQNPLGARIITNAMSSYVAFQDWGNRPATYAQPANSGNSNKYWNVLSALEGVHTQTGTESAFTTLQESILPVIKISMADAGNDGLKDEKVLEPAIRFDFVLQFFDEGTATRRKEFQILFLDSRTMRGFSAYKDDHAPQLIRTDKLEDAPAQGNTPAVTDGVFSKLDDEFRTNIIIAPTPIFGKPFVEYAQYGQALGVLGINNRYKAIKPRFTVDKDGDGFPDDKQEKSFISNDREAWLFNEKSFTAILAQLCRVESLVILSGDVHYAFSMQARIWDNRNVGNSTVYTNEKRCTVAQLVASACKNQDSMTRLLRITTARLKWYNFAIWGADSEYATYIDNAATGIPVKVKPYRPIELEDYVQRHDKLQSHDNLLVRYAFMPIKDKRRNGSRRDGTVISPLTVNNPRLKASIRHHHVTEVGWGETINVGYNNIGVVRFGTDMNGLLVIHEILHRRRTATRHEISLAPVLPSEPRPGD